MYHQFSNKSALAIIENQPFLSLPHDLSPQNENGKSGVHIKCVWIDFVSENFH